MIKEVKNKYSQAFNHSRASSVFKIYELPRNANLAAFVYFVALTQSVRVAEGDVDAVNIAHFAWQTTFWIRSWVAFVRMQPLLDISQWIVHENSNIRTVT